MALRKYVFIQDDPFFLPRVLDKYLREYCDSTVGINLQSVAQGKRSLLETAWSLYRVYGFRYFQWKLRRYIWFRMKAKILDDWLSWKRKSFSVRGVAKKYGVPVTGDMDVNSEEFRAHLRDLDVDLIVSISGTQFYGRELREQTPSGIINCHGGLLPRYRGLMPSFWTLRNEESEGGVSVHYVDEKLDNGPIIVQERYRIHPWDSLEDVMARSKDLAAEAIIEAVRKIEAGDPELLPNDSARATSYSMPTPKDGREFRETGHRFV